MQALLLNTVRRFTAKAGIGLLFSLLSAFRIDPSRLGGRGQLSPEENWLGYEGTILGWIVLRGEGLSNVTTKLSSNSL